MKNLVFVLLVLLGSVSVLRAEEGAPAAETQKVLPSCDDEKLIEQLQNKIQDYYRKNPPQSLIEKRSQKLILRNFNHFNEVDVAGFTNKDSIIVANKLLMTKINNGLQDDEIRLCQTEKNPRLPNVYIMIHPENFYYMVEILNFSERAASNMDLFFIYE